MRCHDDFWREVGWLPEVLIRQICKDFTSIQRLVEQAFIVGQCVLSVEIWKVDRFSQILDDWAIWLFRDFWLGKLVVQLLSDQHVLSLGGFAGLLESGWPVVRCCIGRDGALVGRLVLAWNVG